MLAEGGGHWIRSKQQQHAYQRKNVPRQPYDTEAGNRPRKLIIDDFRRPAESSEPVPGAIIAGARVASYNCGRRKSSQAALI